FHEQIVHVFGGGEFHEVMGERHHAEHVDPELLGEFGAPRQCGELRGMGTGPDHLHRMRIEGHQYGWDAARGSRLHRPADQLRVTAMNTVEHADCEHAPPPVRGYVVET